MSFHWSQFAFLFYTLKPEGPQDKSGALGKTISCPLFPEPLNVILPSRTDCAEMMKDCEMQRLSQLCGWAPKVITRVLKRGMQKGT